MTTTKATSPREEPDLTRPITGIENRSALEVFDIMSARIRGFLSRPPVKAASPEGEIARVRHCANPTCRATGRCEARGADKCALKGFALKITPEWAEKMAEREGDQEVGAGYSLLDAATPPPPETPEASTPNPASQGEREAWVLQRNDFPHAVYFDESEARAECERQRASDKQWRDDNAHVADVKTFWNVYKADRGFIALARQPANPAGQGGAGD